MWKPLAFLRKLALLPVKCGLWTSLAALGIFAVGSFSPQLLEGGAHAVATVSSWFSHSAGDATFDPGVLTSPEKELDLIRSVNEDVNPQLRRAQILIRKQSAELEYLKEQRRFIEHRAGKGEGAESGRAELASLAATIANKHTATDEDRARFQRLGGPTWLALRERSDALETTLAHLLRLQQRVELLSSKLETRRIQTLRFVPRNANTVGASESKRPGFYGSEFEQSETILESVHETLFKTVYALDPTLVQDEDAPNTDR